MRYDKILKMYTIGTNESRNYSVKKLQNLKQKHNSGIGYICALLLFTFVFHLNTNGQCIRTRNTRNWDSKFTIGIERGIASQIIRGNSSLNFTSIPTNSEAAINLSETRLFDQHLSSSALIGIEALYKITPAISIGLAYQFRNQNTYNSKMIFNQDKLILSNDLAVSSFGEFKLNSDIRNTSISVVTHLNIFNFSLTNEHAGSFEIGLGGGISFFKIKSFVSQAFLRMDIQNDYVEGRYILGPGNISPETKRSASCTWQLITALNLKSTYSPDIKIGFRISSLGHFIILKRNKEMHQLFKLTSANTGSQDQELSLLSTNSSREIILNEIFIRIYLW